MFIMGSSNVLESVQRGSGPRTEGHVSEHDKEHPTDQLSLVSFYQRCELTEFPLKLGILLSEFAIKFDIQLVDFSIQLAKSEVELVLKVHQRDTHLRSDLVKARVENR